MITAQKDHRSSDCRISPSVMFDAGYRDGSQGRKNYALYNRNGDYTRGNIAGYRARSTSLFNLPATVEAPLERGWGDELLNEEGV